MESNTIHTFRDLRYWQTAFLVIKQIFHLLPLLPNTKSVDSIVNQLVRAAGSVGANIAEGYGRYTGKEYERFLQIALGSATETEHWLLVLIEFSANNQSKINQIIELNQQTTKMLFSTIKTLKSRH